MKVTTGATPARAIRAEHRPRAQLRQRAQLVEHKFFEPVVRQNARELFRFASLFFGELNHFIKFIRAAKKVVIHRTNF